MKLQLALDTLTLDECMTLLAETKGSVDIAEVGTPFIIEEGMRPVREFKQTLKFWQMQRLWMQESWKRKQHSGQEQISLPCWEQVMMRPFWEL